MQEKIAKKIAFISAALCMLGMITACSEPSDAGKPENSTSIEQETQPNMEQETHQAAEDLDFVDNITGSADGYDYELWKDQGDTIFHVEPGGGCFSCEWKNINNALFRRGRKFDCTQTYEQLGNISVDYGVDYQPVGNSYMCV